MSRNQKKDLSTPLNSSPEFKPRQNIWEIQPSIERLAKEIRGSSRDENIDFSSVTCEPSTRRKRRMSPIFEVPGDNAENKVHVFFDRFAEVCKQAGKTDKIKILQSLKFLFFDELELEKKTRDSIQRIWLEMGNNSHETSQVSSVNSTPTRKGGRIVKENKTGGLEIPDEGQPQGPNSPTATGSSREVQENKVDLKKAQISKETGKAVTFQIGKQKRTKPATSGFECAFCNKNFTKKGNLNTHILIHTGEKYHKCSQCDKQLTQVSNLKKHSIVHLDEKGRQKMRKLWKHGCYFCHKKFITPSILNDHLMTHTEEKPHKCPRCNLRFTQKINMRTHEKSKHLAV